MNMPASAPTRTTGPYIKLLLLILGAAGVWALGMLGLYRFFVSSLRRADPAANLG